MKIYPFSITNKMFKIGQSDNNLWGTKNTVLQYSITQALKTYPDHIIKEIKYQRIKDGTEDPVGVKCDEHRWNIILESVEDFIKGDLNES